MTHPRLAVEDDKANGVVEAFVAGLQAGHDARDADILNAQFAGDVVWGSPYGALVLGFDALHPMHERFQSQAGDGGPLFRYEVRHVLPLGDVIVVHIARLALGPDGVPLPPRSEQPGYRFSEMAMYVLVHRHGEWWLAAGQNTPMRPGGAVPARS